MMAAMAIAMATATKRAMATNRNNAGTGDRKEGGKQATAALMPMGRVTATTWVMATVTRLVGNKEGKGEGGGKGRKTISTCLR